MKARPTPKKLPTQIKVQFAQTILEQFVQTVPPFPKKTENKQKDFAQTVVQTVLFGWVVFEWVAFP